MSNIFKANSQRNLIIHTIEVKKKLLDISKPNMTVELRNVIREKQRLKNCFDKYPITFGRSLKQCKRNYFKEKFLWSTINDKKFYGTINEAMERRPRNNKIYEITVNGNTFEKQI